MDEITPVKTKFRMEQWIQLIIDLYLKLTHH